MSFPAHTPTVDTEKQTVKVTVWRRATILLTLLALVVLLNVPQVAWVSGVLFSAAIGTVIMTMVRVAPLKPSPVVYVMYSLVIVMCLFMAFSSLVTALFSGVSNKYAECVHNATTISRQQQCSTDMEAHLMDALTGK